MNEWDLFDDLFDEKLDFKNNGNVDKCGDFKIGDWIYYKEYNKTYFGFIISFELLNFNAKIFFTHCLEKPNTELYFPFNVPINKIKDAEKYSKFQTEEMIRNLIDFALDIKDKDMFTLLSKKLNSIMKK